MNKGWFAVIFGGLFVGTIALLRKAVSISLVMFVLFIGIAWFKGDVIGYFERADIRQELREQKVEQERKDALAKLQAEAIIAKVAAEEAARQAQLKKESDERVAALVQAAKDKAAQIVQARAERLEKERAKEEAEKQAAIELAEHIKTQAGIEQIRIRQHEAAALIKESRIELARIKEEMAEANLTVTRNRNNTGKVVCSANGCK